MAGNLVIQLVNFYTWLIIAYVLMSWFPTAGILADIQRVLATLVEPYLSLFRRFIPPIGMIDISALVAILVLEAAAGLLVRVL